MMTIRQLAALAMTGLLAAGCAPQGSLQGGMDSAMGTKAPTPVAAPAAPTGSTLTSEGYGPLGVGMSASKIARAFSPAGGGDLVSQAGDGVCIEGVPTGAPPGLRLMIEDKRLTRVTLGEGATIKTDAGVGIGDPASAVDAAYGRRVNTQPAKYVRGGIDKTVWTRNGPQTRDWTDDDTARGLRFEIGADGKITAIHAGGPSIQYVEGCS